MKMCQHRRQAVDRDGVVYCLNCGAAYLPEHDGWGEVNDSRADEGSEG